MSAFPDEVLTARSVIISGPPMTGEYRLFHELLGERGDIRLVIASGTTADELREHHTDYVEDGRSVKVVDCISEGRGDTPPDDEMTQYVDSPGNLTAIGVKITEFLEEVKDGPDTVVVGVYSLTQLLMHAGLESTYQFLHILAQQTAAEDIPLVTVINDRAHDEQTLNAILERFECYLETRTTNGTTEFRARTSTGIPTDWTAL